MKYIMPLMKYHIFLGFIVKKATSAGDIRDRRLSISRDRFALFVTSMKSTNSVLRGTAKKITPIVTGRAADKRNLKVRRIDINDIDFINVGYACTRKLENCRKKKRENGYDDDRVDCQKDQIVSISYDGGSRFLDIFIEDKEIRTIFCQTLREIKETHEVAQHFTVDGDRLLRYIWFDLKKNKDGNVSYDDFKGILDRVNLNVSKPKDIFHSFCSENNINVLTYDQCVTLIHRIRDDQYGKRDYASKPFFFEIWKKFFGDIEYVSAQVFLENFLHECQKEYTTTIDDVYEMIEIVHQVESSSSFVNLRRSGHLSIYDFEIFLLHKMNDAFDPDHQQVYQDMNLPLTDYWINTSHNTYLVGDQLQSKSSVEMYMMSLQLGCKCLELDC